MVISDRTKGCCSSDLNEPPHPNHDQFAELDAHNSRAPGLLDLAQQFTATPARPGPDALGEFRAIRCRAPTGVAVRALPRICDGVW